MRIRKSIIALFALSAAFTVTACFPEEKDSARKETSTSSEKDSGEKKSAAPQKGEADYFKDCVSKSGTATEKKAVQHVVKITGVDRKNDILDSADVYTDFTGGFASDDSGSANLIVAAFGSCYESNNGLVTIFGEDGNMITNGQY